MEKVKKLAIAFATAVISWLLLSFVFFPIKLSATSDLYFAETMTNLLPLKAIITTIFTAFAVFMYQQKMKKASQEK